ncbi:protein HIDE1 isoform X3 [Vombatus ursinus]|nr:protein HIDE1 isoform X3 [Vombatus ursinus]XP_027706710.1 protein HIDE1 isoform X3 [Vombatus ursinus]XP_027706712.1 protein HIDE1 isoform X3 [Vombatus ursinus]
MPWKVLFFVTGSLAIPAPSISQIPPYPSNPGDPIHLQCLASPGFQEAEFSLFHGDGMVQALQAQEAQQGVVFTVTNTSEGLTVQYQCQYSVMGEIAKQFSDLSKPVNVTFPVYVLPATTLPTSPSKVDPLGKKVPSWILPLSLGLAGAFVLIMILVATILMIRRVKVTNLQKKREQESCWTKINYTTSDMSFDNSLFSISMKMTPEDVDTHGTFTSSTLAPEPFVPRKRPTSTSSIPELPEFSTFRSFE